MHAFRNDINSHPTPISKILDPPLCHIFSLIIRNPPPSLEGAAEVVLFYNLKYLYVQYCIIEDDTKITLSVQVDNLSNMKLESESR